MKVRTPCDTSACIEVETVTSRDLLVPADERVDLPGILIRTTLTGRSIVVTRNEWDAFVAAVKAGVFEQYLTRH